MIDRRISNSKKLGTVDDRARVMWVWLYVYTDKEGRVKYDDLDDLIQDCIPRFKDYSIDSIVKAIEDLDKIDLLVLYPYKDPIHPAAFALQFERFRDFQTIRENREGKSRIPEPPEGARITPGVERDHYSFTPLLSLSLSLSKEVRKEEEEQNIHKLIKIKQEIYKELQKVKGLGKAKAEKLANFIVDELMPEFPDIDIIEQVKKKCTWWKDQPLNKNSRPHAQMRTWFRKEQNWINEAKAQHSVGRQQKPGIKTKDMIKVAQKMNEAEAIIISHNKDLRGEALELKIKKARAEASQEYWRLKDKKK